MFVVRSLLPCKYNLYRAKASSKHRNSMGKIHYWNTEMRINLLWKSSKTLENGKFFCLQNLTTFAYAIRINWSLIIYSIFVVWFLFVLCMMNSFASIEHKIAKKDLFKTVYFLWDCLFISRSCSSFSTATVNLLACMSQPDWHSQSACKTCIFAI